MNCDVGEATEGLENSCDVGKVTEGLENELWRRWSDGKGWRMSSAMTIKMSSAHSPTYVTDHSPILPLLHLSHSSFSNHSFASPTSQALHLTSPREPPMGMRCDEAPIFKIWELRVYRPKTPVAPQQGWMKWNEMNEMSVEKWGNEIVAGENGWNLEKTLSNSITTTIPHGVTETRTRDPSGERWATMFQKYMNIEKNL